MMIRPHTNFAARLLAGLLLTATMTGVLLAQPSDAAAQSREQMAEAREHFLNGRKLYESAEYLAAAESFRKAYELSNRTELLYNVGQAYRLADRLEEAEKYFQEYLTEQPDAANAEEVVETIIEIQQAMAARMASVAVQSEPGQRSVFVDNEKEARCKSPCNLSLTPGTYTIHVRDEGWITASQKVSVNSGDKSQLNFRLEKNVVKGALVLHTDVRQGLLRVAPSIERTLPLSEPLRLEPGLHQVEITSGSRGHWRGQITIEPDATTEILVPMQALTDAQQAASPLKSVAYGLGGATLAFVTGAVIMGMQASSTHQALETQRQAFGSVNNELLEQGRSEQFGANLLWGASALTLLSGVGLYVWDWMADGDEPAQAASSSDATSYPEPAPNTGVELLD
ncbi:MAG: PEGA domain-containing protein [Bradymonadaceae bacterium]|nr:PEGA domain-containing protein [Lujinxingiaceae bacterium]